MLYNIDDLIKEGKNSRTSPALQNFILKVMQTLKAIDEDSSVRYDKNILPEAFKQIDTAGITSEKEDLLKGEIYGGLLDNRDSIGIFVQPGKGKWFIHPDYQAIDEIPADRFPINKKSPGQKMRPRAFDNLIQYELQSLFGDCADFM